MRLIVPDTTGVIRNCPINLQITIQECMSCLHYGSVPRGMAIPPVCSHDEPDPPGRLHPSRKVIVEVAPMDGRRQYKIVR